ncbi:SusC/RagA family TonB-linked outer membrane protein [Plebeiibacterium marinum]|uniref:SusC/RagA family TonB-linked outer membrane protein n=1 Tax=Plebeiibacterium marinum TaxID=2992111 RepID=A0AAE3SLJ3_9BACT|nr:SusC/RagA family TonB-linked outer membrane protein [Plebeiobacterium marinum]MCW3807757.1 SusC/RagA family TonB-linked outer membrane protein [Plebeiobacterium marinum]
MNKLLILTIIFSFTVFINAFSQESLTISGQVLDELNEETMPGVNVVALDKSNRIITGTITNLNGEFILKLKGSITKLKFTFIGYKEQEVELTDKDYYKVIMTEDVVTIDAVQVMAEKKTETGFMDIADRDLAIAVGKISADEFDDVQATSIDDALQGRLAGVDIAANSGDPGAGMSIRIRGVSTLSANSDPLIVVDNVPFETTITSDFDFATANEEGYAQMLNISVSDIKDITVLKDAAATAPWGTKAANGVLMITTKRGIKGRKPQVSYTYRGTFTEEPDALPTLNGGEYQTLIREAYRNTFNFAMPQSSYPEIYANKTQPYYYYNFGQDTDWMDAISRNGFTHNHDLAISGGGEKATYRFSVNSQTQEGVTLGTSLERLTTRLNLDYFISDKLRLRADFSYAHGTTSGNYTESGVIKGTRSIRSTAYRMMPNMSIHEYNAKGELTGNYFSPERTPQGAFPSMYNPVALAKYGLHETINDRIITKFSLNYRITDALKYSIDLSLDVNSNKLKQMLPQEATGVSATSRYANRMIDRDDDSYNIYTNNKLTYHKEFNEKHKLTATLNVQTTEYIGTGSYLYNTNGISSSIPDASGAGRDNVSGYGGRTSNGQGRTLGALAMFHYSLLDRYIISAGMRREGNSRFDDKYRWGYFPSLSAAWRLSGEPFLSYLEFLDDLRIRFSYGENGNPPRYESMFYSNYRSYDFAYLGTTGVYPGNMQLQNLKWESIKSSNLGISAELFKGRISTDVDFYKTRTEDMFAYNVKTQSSSGYSTTPVMNVSTMDNYGWDFQLKTIPFKTKDWTVTLDFNIARNYNILRELADDFSTVVAETPGNGEYKRYAQINNPAGSFYGYRYKGVYTNKDQLIARDVNGNKITDPNGNPTYMIYDYGNVNYKFELGDAMYEDVNHDGNINTADIVLLGDANPEFFGGIGQRITYKNFSFNYYFYYRVGNDIINRTKMNGESMYSFDNQTKAVLRRWSKPGDETDIPRALLGYGYNWLGSDRFVEDGSFVRLKYITLAYKIPKKWTKKLGMQSARISTTLNNLFTFTDYSGQDPEISIKSNDGTIYTVGYDDSNTPRTRDVTCTLNITF